jgi:DNA-binding NtrC family response regulator
MMENSVPNVFIIAEKALVVTGLRHALTVKFGDRIQVSAFYDSRTMLGKVDDKTTALILDYFFEGKRGINLLKAARVINPAVEGIMHSSTDDVVAAIERLLSGELRQQVKKYSHKLENQFL